MILKFWLLGAKVLSTMVSIGIVADCVVLSCQVTRKLKWANALYFITIPATIYIQCVCPA